MSHQALLWIALLAYGAVMWVVSPRVRGMKAFYAGTRTSGEAPGSMLLVASVVMSWVFAKSITNAANLGYRFGLVGSVAYAGWYLSIPVAAVVIYRLRVRHGGRSLPQLLVRRYGRLAAGVFLLVVFVRLFNEVWSNTAVVGSYFGAAGSAGYIGGALVFAGLTLAYSLRGGLRSSILTDGIQFGLGIFLLVFVLALVLPRSGAAPLLHAGHWTMAGGVDLLLVGLLQSFSYPFHDPVLTDRAFLTAPRTMLRAFFAAGLVAAAFIVLFGLVGVHARLAGLTVHEDAPVRVAHAFGVAVLAAMTILMMASAGSTLDSTFSSFAKATVMDLGGAGRDGEAAARFVLPAVARWVAGTDPVRLGRLMMVLVVVAGSLPLFAGAAILKATTVSGTMVLGLAPVMLLYGWGRSGPWAFHLAVWPGLVLGLLHAAGLLPAALAIGHGAYAELLGVNVYGTLLVFTGFGVGTLVERRAPSRALSAPVRTP